MKTDSWKPTHSPKKIASQDIQGTTPTTTEIATATTKTTMKAGKTATTSNQQKMLITKN